MEESIHRQGSVLKSETIGAPRSGARYNGIDVAGDKVTVDDFTIIYCVRLHDDNEWIASRIDAVSEYYSPCPKVLVLDFGSAEKHASTVRNICSRHGYDYHFIGDSGVFSLAIARNVAFEQSSTDFVFFSDPDFIAERDLFTRLAAYASAIAMRTTIDVVLNLPAYHLDEADTRNLEAIVDPNEQTTFLRSLAFKLAYGRTDAKLERFVAPYSNVFLINRKMFSLTGGYNTDFRGHGSEDFEFLLRLCLHSAHLPLPPDAAEDLYGPLRNEFYMARPYRGFRRLFELMAHPSETLGLKVFHRHHPRAKEGAWYSTGDRRRERFKSAVSRYVDSHHRLLSVDYLSRAKKVACLCKNVDTWGYFVPLRLVGYETVPILDDGPETIAELTRDLAAGVLSAVAVFNPYMTSHSQFKPVVALARELGREVIVLERGALPSTIYYDEDVCYNSPNFSPEAFSREIFSDEEMRGAQQYVERLRLGNETLESMDTYERTYEKYAPLRHLIAKKCFIPLQLEDDMAVTMFIKGHQSYVEFVKCIDDLVAENPDVFFVIKPHPLSKVEFISAAPNMVIADRMDNIHAIIDSIDVTIVYNSGVGLLSILHGRPTVTLGNAFYNVGGSGYQAVSARDGLEKFLTGSLAAPDQAVVSRLAAWFIFRKYSRFAARDHIREFERRKSHEYKNIAVTEFRWRDHNLRLGRLKEVAPFSWMSYAAARIAPTEQIRDGESRDGETYLRWGLKDFHEGEFTKSADFLMRAFALKPDRPNIVRYAAEAHLKSADRKAAIAAQKLAVSLLPENKRVRLRLWTMRLPWLAILLGSHEFKVPKR